MKVKQRSGKASSTTRTNKTQKNIETGSLGSTGSTSKTERESSLEKEAKSFIEKKRPLRKPKPMTSRIYLAGMAMNALMVRGSMDSDRVKKEAYRMADFMLDD